MTLADDRRPIAWEAIVAAVIALLGSAVGYGAMGNRVTNLETENAALRLEVAEGKGHMTQLETEIKVQLTHLADEFAEISHRLDNRRTARRDDP